MTCVSCPRTMDTQEGTPGTHRVTMGNYMGSQSGVSVWGPTREETGERDYWGESHRNSDPDANQVDANQGDTGLGSWLVRVPFMHTYVHLLPRRRPLLGGLGRSEGRGTESTRSRSDKYKCDETVFVGQVRVDPSVGRREFYVHCFCIFFSFLLHDIRPGFPSPRRRGRPLSDPREPPPSLRVP